MKIGLFGGSFNPIHNGHIALGMAMLSAMSLDEVWYMVSPQNPLKRQISDLIDEKERFKMVQMALDEYPHLTASDYEFHLPRPSYTWDTLQQLKKDFPEHEFTLIIGGDNMANFQRWAHHEEILRNYPIAVYPREGEDITIPDTGDVTVINVPLVNISSTQIRNMIRNGEDITPYVPKKVAQQVEIYSLYG